MQIGCPQCSMQYELDPRLLPPAGASVQCTRCSFVFTATPSGKVLVPPQAQSAQGGSTARVGEVSRTSSASTTRIFGIPQGTVSPPAERSASASQSTRIFGVPPGLSRAPAAPAAPPPDDSEKTPAYGTLAEGLPGGEMGKTQVFGAPPPARVPPATTTQVFGAVSVPSPATTTQVFGAPSLPPPAPPPTTTQVFGASAIPASPAAPATTQAFGASQIQAADRAAGVSVPSQDAGGTVPWMVESGAGGKQGRGKTGESRAAAPRAAPVDLPPQAPVPLPTPPPVALPPESPVESRGGSATGSRRGSALTSQEIFERLERESPAQEAPEGPGVGRYLLILAAVGVLALTAWLTYPVWRNQGSELPAEALTTKDQAVALLRRDDAASREQALEQLRALVVRFPKFTEAQAELLVALALQLDDSQVELAWISEQQTRLRREIASLQLAQAPADWESRVNSRKEELEALGEQRRPLEAAIGQLTKQGQEALMVIRAAPETEPAADVVARLKAQAVHAGVTGNPQALALAERLRKVENPSHWSALSLAEYGLNAGSPPSALEELSEALREVRERDNTLIRAYVLGARLALRQREPAVARSLLDTALALNPNHALARKLQQWSATLGTITP
ncbi:zinc-ribbon domain-containing protein [Hyalangium rubrum]|uniref:Zinc-ribbon domain-containing protein n=1 Tax=Hyalangium rubrum TaxID=3103134 RepID=A0ABU5HE75_9BACT|nr:zinc-ribbon domain-containing protein [Hyalangium sp. s54d21]MDY7231656.1 zinc-ribbon domain-containing protein [Hyalangium sp. s54d21]